MNDFLDIQSQAHKKVIDAIQHGFPVESRPFDRLAAEFQLDSSSIMDFLHQCFHQGIIRQIGPVFEPRKLGYVSTLIAASIPDDQLETVAGYVSSHPGVSHNYQRNHPLNLWFTLTVPTPQAIDDYIQHLKSRFHLDRVYSLPTIKMFKLKVRFNIADNPEDESESLEPDNPHLPPKVADSASEINISESQQELIRQLQNGLPIEPQPYLSIANKINQTESQVIDQIKLWLQHGVIRRMAARMKHQKMGYRVNAMVVFDLPDDQIEQAGRQLAAFPCVSHCYHRPSAPDWPFTLFAMTHTKDTLQLETTVRQMLENLHPRQHDILRSVCEFKKQPVRYFIEPVSQPSHRLLNFK